MLIKDIKGFQYYIVLKNIQYIYLGIFGEFYTIVFANNEEIRINYDTYKKILEKLEEYE